MKYHHCMPTPQEYKIAADLKAAIEAFENSLRDLENVQTRPEGFEFTVPITGQVNLKLTRSAVITMAEESRRMAIFNVNRIAESFKMITKSPDRGGPEDR